MTNKKAFTLTELLVALGIIGAIAALSIPSMMNTINEKILITKLKSTVNIIQQLIADQKLKYKTDDLTSTDFADATKLMTTENFDAAKTCTTDNWQDCWTNSNTVYTYVCSTNHPGGMKDRPSVLLKNGAIIGFKAWDGTATGSKVASDKKTIGTICFDINGADGPNMGGRDYFCVHVTKKGRLIGLFEYKNKTVSHGCDNEEKADAGYYYERVVENNWKFD